MTQPFGMVEAAIKQLIETKYPAAAGKVGGDLSYDGSGLYVWVGLVGGSADLTSGEWVVDIDTFGETYALAMKAALDLEAVLIGPRHTTATMRIDNCFQNEVPTERPWSSEAAFRIGATYVFTARRTG